MTIGLQGTWSVSVKSKSASWAHRFIIDGTDSGDGTYVGDVTTPPVLASGAQWGITIEADPSGPDSWRSSRMRLVDFRRDAGFFKIDIESDDGGGLFGEEDFNDLVLTISKPLSSSEWIVYGTAKSYSGPCASNPCFPLTWFVVDRPEQLVRLLGYDEVRPIFENVYGRDVELFAHREPFIPLMLSRGGSVSSGTTVRAGTKAKQVSVSEAQTADLELDDLETVFSVQSFEYQANITSREAQLLDSLMLGTCEVNPIAQAIMRFVEYDRTDAELGGAAYTGLGDRETLGVGATDEFGNYVFSFTRTPAQSFDEANQDTPSGGSPLTSIDPDVIIQFTDDPEGVATYETAPYFDIANVRRIDLCIPAGQLVPKPCRGDKVLQYLGDIPIVKNPGSELHADGTITNGPTSESGPTITHGAWRGVLDIIGCFEDSIEPVTHYTLEYQVGSGGWNYLSVAAKGLRQQGTGIWLSESYGATSTALSIGVVPAYRNIERESGWSLEVQNRKARVDLRSLLPAPDVRVEDVRFVIRGYDATGDFVPGTSDDIKLKVDYVDTVADIASIVIPGGADLNDCAMLDLPSDTTALAVRLRVFDADGFLANWSLSAVRGSNVPVGLTDSATAIPPAGAYPGATVDDRYYGTIERTDADASGYVTINITPPSSGWLGTRVFCAYSFELHARERTTDGKHTRSSRKRFDEVVGMRPAPTS